MKIMLIWENSDWGGVESWLAYLLNSWPEGQYNFVIVSNLSNKGLPRLNELLKKRASFRFVRRFSFGSDLYGKSIIKLILKASSLILLFLDLIRYILLLNVEKPDVIVGVNGGYPGALGVLSSLIAAKICKVQVRILVIHHAASKPIPIIGYFQPILDYILSYLVTSIICISRATLSTLGANTHLLANPNLWTRVIPNGIDMPKEEIGTLVDRPKRNDDLAKIAVIGRQDPYKGIYDIISAISMLRLEERLLIRLDVLGYSRRIEAESLLKFAKALGVEDNIRLVGYRTGSIFESMKEFDAIVVATRNFEGFGLTAAEALAAGVPLISTTVGGLAEFVNNNNATCFQPSDAKELSLIFSRLIKNPAFFRTKVDVGMSEIQKFNSKKMAKEYCEHIELSYKLFAK